MSAIVGRLFTDDRDAQRSCGPAATFGKNDARSERHNRGRLTDRR